MVVLDVNGDRLQVGDRVAFGGRVVSISDPDGDVDGINPSVTVAWEGVNGEESFGTSTADCYSEQYACDYLIRLETAT